MLLLIISLFAVVNSRTIILLLLTHLTENSREPSDTITCIHVDGIFARGAVLARDAGTFVDILKE